MHVLNVRAANMSAFPDEPDHFVRWLRDTGHEATARCFLPRRVYGAYLRALLLAASSASPDRLAVVQGDAVDLVNKGHGVSIQLAGGETIEADVGVLALGNLPPHSPPGLHKGQLDPDFYFGDPWRHGSASGLAAEDHVLVLGTGLTMVDMVLKLRREGFEGPITALSRRGLLPHSHDEQAPYEPITQRPKPEATKLLSAVRDRARAVGWRNAVDELRPFTQSLWRAADRQERGRFLRHLRPWWDSHRHRIAPFVAEDLDRQLASGKLKVMAARTCEFSQEDGGVLVTYRRRRSRDTEAAIFRRLINCIGPQGDLSRTSEPLLKSLAKRGMIRPDADHLGIDVDAQCRVVGTDDHSSDRLLAIGPMTRGAFWEIVAVPDIRVQTWSVARQLSNAHWVGGEGL
jgi:uncharacterized NAD(P)/FAD-binding protein YdhS